jgi:hypothetical protein
MYNPVNMKVEDSNRLKEKDQREWNKKARYNVKYEFEKMTKEEGAKEMERQQALKLNKITGIQFQEEVRRGFDIVTNEKLDGKANSLKVD